MQTTIRACVLEKSHITLAMLTTSTPSDKVLGRGCSLHVSVKIISMVQVEQNIIFINCSLLKNENYLQSIVILISSNLLLFVHYLLINF